MHTFGIHSGLVSLYNSSNAGEVIKMLFSIVVADNIIKAHCSRIKLPMCITGGGGGGVEGDGTRSDIRAPKNQISDIRPPKKTNIRYHAFAKNQIYGF